MTNKHPWLIKTPKQPADFTPGEYINWYNQLDHKTYRVKFMGWEYPDKRRLWIVHKGEWRPVSPKRCERIQG